MKKNTIISIIISLALIGGTLYIISSESPSAGGLGVEAQNVEIRDGIQFVTVSAKGGYFPSVSTIKGGVPTKLIMKTDSTYDCTASLVINSIGFQKTLQPTGEEVIDLGTPKSGEKIQGVCGMGMYNFQIWTG